jgi:lariat debranching enzyme
MNDFHKYYSGEKVAPVLTVFIGGNHEASNYLRELYYGGWVAPNIYYMGYAGVVEFKGLRIGGMSGIYNSRNYRRPYNETLPYNSNDLRSVYHTRELEVMKLCQIKEKVDIFLSHDWPKGIELYGDTAHLLRRKRHFEKDVRSGQLGSVAAMEVLKKIRPDFWFSAHLHVKFSALVRWNDTAAECHRCDEGGKAGDRISDATKFLALDKCLPRRHFLQIITVKPRKKSRGDGLMYDQEWLDIVKRSHHLIENKEGGTTMNATSSSSTGKHAVAGPIPNNFVQTVSLDEAEVKLRGNPQTDAFLHRLGLKHGILTIPYNEKTSKSSEQTEENSSGEVSSSKIDENIDDDNEIDIGDI